MVQRFMVAKKNKGITKKSQENYRYFFRGFIKKFPVLPLKPEEIEEFLIGTSENVVTRQSYDRKLRALYNFLVLRGVIATSKNPMKLIEKPVPAKKVARSLTTEELRQLFTAHHPKKHLAFLLFLANTGVRLSEALSADTPEKFKENTVMVRGKEGEHEVPISPDVRAEVLQAIPWPWASYFAASRAVRRAFRRAGITGKRASAHTLRHTFVQHWEGDESVLIEIMGWTTGRMLQVYKAFHAKRAVQQHRQYNPLNTIKGPHLPNLF